MAKSLLLAVIIGCISSPICSSLALAVEPTSIATLAQAAKGQTPAEITAKQEAAANELVEKHLPELKTVLTSLRKSRTREYKKAIGELSRASRRLELYRQQDAIAYDLEIRLLQTQTRADLALAQLQIKDSEKNRAAYRGALEARENAKLARVKHEAKRLQDRLAKMESQLDRMNKTIESSDISASVNKAFSLAVKRLDQKKETVARQKRKTTSSNSKVKSEK